MIFRMVIVCILLLYEFFKIIILNLNKVLRFDNRVYIILLPTLGISFSFLPRSQEKNYYLQWFLIDTLTTFFFTFIF